VITTALPKCPRCKQSATGVYHQQLGCHRCRALSFDTRRPTVKIGHFVVPLVRVGLVTDPNPTAVAITASTSLLVS